VGAEPEVEGRVVLIPVAAGAGPAPWLTNILVAAMVIIGAAFCFQGDWAWPSACFAFFSS